MKLWTLPLLCLTLVVLTSCKTLEEKPDTEGCFNLGVGGYGGCATTQTNRRRILSPAEWNAMRAGPGFWFMPEAIAADKKFVLRLCERTKMCSDADKREVSKRFDLFLGTPSEILNPAKPKEETK